MRILLSTGIEKLENQLEKFITDKDISIVGRCYNKDVLLSVLNQLGADTVVLSINLVGSGDIYNSLIRPLRDMGIRVILLPGSNELKETGEVIKNVLPMGIYDFVYDPVNPEKIIHRILNPGKLGDIPRELYAEAMRGEELSSEISSLIEGLEKGVNRRNAKKTGLLRGLFKGRKEKHESKEANFKAFSSGDNEFDFDESCIDFLTKCLNRKGMEKVLNTKMGSYLDKGIAFSIAFFDLDHFKIVNDTFGHQAGDVVLREFANYIKANVRQTDIVVRYGGEEFMVIFSGNMDALSLVERIREGWALNQVKLPSGETINSTFSAGLAKIKQDADNIEELIKVADDALYRAKRTGRNKVLTAESPMLSKRAYKNCPDLNEKIIILSGYMAREVVRITGDIKGKLFVIDADIENANLAVAFGCNQELLWQSDWRAGATAEPFKASKNVQIYGLDPDTKNNEPRDLAVLADLILRIRKSGQKVLINTGNNQEILRVVNSIKGEEKNCGLRMR